MKIIVTTKIGLTAKKSDSARLREDIEVQKI